MKSSLFAFALVLASTVAAHAVPMNPTPTPTPTPTPAPLLAPRIQVVADQSFLGKMSTGKILNLNIQADGTVQKSVVSANMMQTLNIKTVDDLRRADGDLVITFDSGEKLEQSARGFSATGDTGIYFVDSTGEQVTLLPVVTIQAQ